MLTLQCGVFVNMMRKNECFWVETTFRDVLFVHNYCFNCKRAADGLSFMFLPCFRVQQLVSVVDEHVKRTVQNLAYPVVLHAVLCAYCAHSSCVVRILCTLELCCAHFVHTPAVLCGLQLCLFVRAILQYSQIYALGKQLRCAQMSIPAVPLLRLLHSTQDC